MSLLHATSVFANTLGCPAWPLQFVAGDDAQATQVVKKPVEELGFEVLDAEPLAAARLPNQSL
jgi:predicted dinucleotide-binding enzyme